MSHLGPLEPTVKETVWKKQKDCAVHADRDQAVDRSRLLCVGERDYEDDASHGCDAECRCRIAGQVGDRRSDDREGSDDRDGNSQCVQRISGHEHTGFPATKTKHAVLRPRRRENHCPDEREIVTMQIDGARSGQEDRNDPYDDKPPIRKQYRDQDVTPTKKLSMLVTLR